MKAFVTAASGFIGANLVRLLFQQAYVVRSLVRETICIDNLQGDLLALERGKSSDRYILGNQNLTLKELLDLLEAITGLPVPRKTILVWLPLTVA